MRATPAREHIRTETPTHHPQICITDNTDFPHLWITRGAMIPVNSCISAVLRTRLCTRRGEDQANRPQKHAKTTNSKVASDQSAEPDTPSRPQPGAVGLTGAHKTAHGHLPRSVSQVKRPKFASFGREFGVVGSDAGEPTGNQNAAANRVPHVGRHEHRRPPAGTRNCR